MSSSLIRNTDKKGDKMTHEEYIEKALQIFKEKYQHRVQRVMKDTTTPESFVNSLIGLEDILINAEITPEEAVIFLSVYALMVGKPK